MNDVPGDSWLNVGLWCSPGGTTTSYSAAATALAIQLGEAAELRALPPGALCVDAGCGLGDGSMLWAKQAPQATFMGVNLCRPQLEQAAEVAAARGLRNISFSFESATQLPLENGAADAVVALESAFHFDTRKRFFEEAARVLKPGGVFAAADIVMSQRGFAWRHWFTNLWLSAFFCIPLVNCVDAPLLVAQLEEAGFTSVRCESLAARTFPGLLACYAARWRMRGGWGKATVTERAFFLLMNWGYRPLMLLAADYVVVSARKKGSDREN